MCWVRLSVCSSVQTPKIFSTGKKNVFERPETYDWPSKGSHLAMSMCSVWSLSWGPPSAYCAEGLHSRCFLHLVVMFRCTGGFRWSANLQVWALFETCSRRPFDAGSNVKISLSCHLEPRFLMQFINFLVVFVTFNVSPTVGYRGDTSLRWGGLGADAEECEKVVKEVVAYDYESEHRLDLAMPPNLACRDKLNSFVVEAAWLGDVETLKWLLNHAMNPSAEFQVRVQPWLRSKMVRWRSWSFCWTMELMCTQKTLIRRHTSALRCIKRIHQTCADDRQRCWSRQKYRRIHSQADVVKVLLDYGEADINGKAGPGEKTPFDVATPEVKDLLKLKLKS